MMIVSRQIFGHEAVLTYAPQRADKLLVVVSFKRRRIVNTAVHVDDNTAVRVDDSTTGQTTNNTVAQMG